MRPRYLVNFFGGLEYRPLKDKRAFELVKNATYRTPNMPKLNDKDAFDYVNTKKNAQIAMIK